MRLAVRGGAGAVERAGTDDWSFSPAQVADDEKLPAALRNP
ncbi:hypothetical protein [Paractinoplanes durhamensis]|nr:hypothetical protein [Actinoplanes durhamensis]